MTEPANIPAGLFVPEGESFLPTEFTRGPWRTDAQHGGPPAALLACIIEPRVESDEFISHVEIELLRPVPLTALRPTCTKHRVSGRVHRIAAELHSDSELVARSTALVLQRSEILEPEWHPSSTAAPTPPDPSRAIDPPRWATGDVTTYHRNAVEHVFVVGTFREPGPAVDWIRLRQPVVVGNEPSGLQRVLAAADFGSGISALYSSESSFGLINTNLTVSLFREPVGEWIAIDAKSYVGDGTGLCITTIGDRTGQVGVATQSLIGYSMG